MTTTLRTQNCSKGARDETTGRQIAPLLSQGELDVGSGGRVQPSNHRRGICRFEIQNYAKAEHHDPSQWYTTRLRAGKCNSSVSRETDDGARHSRALPHSGRAVLMPCVLTGAIVAPRRAGHSSYGRLWRPSCSPGELTPRHPTRCPETYPPGLRRLHRILRTASPQGHKKRCRTRSR